ncbi:MAG: class I SAM-dependent methyltransferase [Solirubrobacterales bacterium]
MRLPSQIEEEARSPEHFAATAEAWDSSYEAQTLRGHWQRCRLEAVVELVGPGPGSLLDVGTGSGRLLAELSARGWSTTGLDPAARMVDLARARAPRARVGVGRAEALPHDDASFDAVTAIGVLEYTDMTKALSEIFRVLRPGGRSVIGLRNGSGPVVAWRRVMHPIARAMKGRVQFGRPPPKRRRPPLRLRQARVALDAADLAVESVEYAGCAVLPDPLDGLHPRLAYRAARGAERSRALRRAFGTQRLLVAAKP